MTEFGRDISCTTSLRTGRYASGVRLVAEAAYRRLSTPRGLLQGGEEEANYGLDLSQMIGSVSSSDVAASLPSQIDAELTKDERIDSVTSSVTSFTDGPATTWLINISCGTSDGAFSLQLSVADLRVELLRITTAEVA